MVNDGRIRRAAAGRWPRGGAALCLASVLAACAPGPVDYGLPDSAQPEVVAVLAPRFCYRTLAEVDCHALPLPGEENRRVGWFDAPVAFVELDPEASDAD